MIPEPHCPDFNEVTALLRGEPGRLRSLAPDAGHAALYRHLIVIVIGSALYGAAMGWERAPQQAFFVAIKFPLVILLTILGNGLLNAMLAPLLGLNISLRQSILTIMMGYTVTASILAAFAPLAFFAVWNTPAMDAAGTHSRAAYSFLTLIHVLAISAAGIIGNTRLKQTLFELSGHKATVQKVWVAWMAANLFLGSQIIWVLRPFIGSPNLPVQFLRPDAFKGSFYETVFQLAKNVSGF